MSVINVTFNGNIGEKGVTFKTLDSGSTVANFSVAVTPRVKQKDGSYEDGKTEWLAVAAWNNLSRRIQASGMKKGTNVTVEGILSSEEFEREDGTKGYALKVTAKSVSLGLPFVKNEGGSAANDSQSLADAIG